MKVKRDRLVIDTNLWISFLLSNNYQKLDTLFNTEKICILFSEELLQEFIEVASRPKFKKYFSETDLIDLLTQIEHKAEFIKVRSNVDACRDPKDNFLLSLAIDGKATHLVSGDKDLLVLKKLEEVKILSMTEYLSR